MATAPEPDRSATVPWPVRSLSAYARFEDVESAWRELVAVATVSPYQSYDVQKNWFDTLGRGAGLSAFIVLARDATGAPVALLPFTLQRQGPLRVARFIGGRETNLNLGLFAPGALDPAMAQRLLREAARLAPAGPDVYDLRNQPRQFDGVANPLAFDTARDSVSFAYGATLPATPEALDARMSKDARKKLRRKEARLAQIGAPAYEHGATGARAQTILATLIAQKSARFAEMGVEPLFERPGMRDFVEAAVARSGEGALELHALSVGDRIVATYAGFAHGARFSAMLNSFDAEDEIARCSPGDLLLHALMRNLVSRGVTRFDLGVGEARYKASVCDETIALCDAITPATAKGAVLAPLIVNWLRLKRFIKQSPRLGKAAHDLRRFLAHRD